MTRREASKAYKEIARELDRLQVAACVHISRRDNNQVFEIAWFLKQVAKRIKDKYPETDYPKLLK